MKKIYIILFIGILLLGSVSAADWDNKLKYSNKDMKVEFSNSFLGITTSDIGSIELKSHKSVDEVRKLGAGKDQTVMWYEMNFKEIYENGFGEVYFTNENSGEEIEKDYYFAELVKEQQPKYKTVCNEIISSNGSSSKECSQVQNGFKQVEVWKRLDTNNIPKGKTTIGLVTDVEVGDYIDAVWTIVGKKVEKHAEWTANLNFNILSYYKLDEQDTSGSGLIIDSLGLNNGTNAGADNVTGIIKSAYDFEKSETDTIGFGDVSDFNFGTSDFSISFWANVESITNGDIFMAKSPGGGASSSYGWLLGFNQLGGTSNSVPQIIFATSGASHAFVSANDAAFSTGSFIHIVAVVDRDNSTNSLMYLNADSTGSTNGDLSSHTGSISNSQDYVFGSESDMNSYYDGILDEVGIWNRALSQSEVTQLYNGGDGIPWVGIFKPKVTLNSPIDFFNTTNLIINFNGTITRENPLNVSLIINDVYNETNTSGVLGDYIFIKTIAEGIHTWNYESCNVNGCLNATARTFTIDTIKPIITLTAPPSIIQSHSIGNPLFLNWTVSDLNLDSCWYDYNNTNTTVTCNDNTTIFNTVTGEQNITFYANDSSGNENSENTSWSYNFLEGLVEFEGNVSETSNQVLEINVTTDIDVQSISAILTYNGINHTSTASCEGGNCTVLNRIDVPLVSTGEFVLYDFFWTLSIFNGTESSSIKTSTREQNVTRIHLEECDATYTKQTLNFTTYDEQNLTRIDPYKFGATFNQWLGTGDVKRQSNFSQASVSEEALCILPENKTYFIDAIIEYDEIGNGTTYTERNYFFQNDTINNVSQEIFMYLLKSSSSTSFILKVQDDSLLPVANVLIEINRFYPGTNEFRVVQIARTDDLGKSVGFFETEIVDYKFFITFNNEILLETGLQKVIPESSPFTLTFNIGDPLGEPWASHLPIDDLNSSLVWNKTSGFVTYTYLDSSDDFTSARLLVIKESLTNISANEIICNESSLLLSATLVCNVGDNAGFYIVSSFITRDSIEQLDKQFGFQIETFSGVVGFLGLFFGWFIILIAAFMFKFNEIAGIWAVTMTVFLINLIGLINFGSVFVTATIGIAIILTWIMEK